MCHDYPWELEVQDYVRDLRPQVCPPDFLLVGMDESGLASVLSMRVAPLDRFAFIGAVAVAQRVSGQGLASEAISKVAAVMSKYGMESDYLVSARIDRNNLAAKSAFTKSGFQLVGNHEDLEEWGRSF